MADNSNTSEPKTVRELAREFVLAGDAYKAAYQATLRLDQPIEARIDAQLACDAASKVMCAANRALEAAQKVAA